MPKKTIKKDPYSDIDEEGYNTDSEFGDSQVSAQTFLEGAKACPQDLDDSASSHDDSALGVSLIESGISSLAIGDISYIHDDTSDEEDEEADVSTLSLDTYPNPSEITDLDIHHSFALQEMGLRILKSAPLRSAYFRIKPKYLSDREVSVDKAKSILEKSITDMFSAMYEKKESLTKEISKLKGKKAQAQKSYDKIKKKKPVEYNKESKLDYKGELSESKQKLKQIDSSLKSKNKESHWLEVLLSKIEKFKIKLFVDCRQEIEELLSDPLLFTTKANQAPFKAIKEQLETFVKTDDRLKKYIIKSHIKQREAELKNKVKNLYTEGGSISKAQGVKKQVLDFLGSSEDIYSNALLESYNATQSAESSSKFLKRVRKKVCSSDEIFLDEYSIMRDMRLALDLPRITLDDMTKFTPLELVGENTSHSIAFLTHLRLTHCSDRRSIKDINYADKHEGLEVARGWKFNPVKTDTVIENKRIYDSGSVSAVVKYPHDSNYSALFSKLKGFCELEKISESEAAFAIKSLLKNGSVGDNLNITQGFQKFLMILTYHLFGVEAARHPAALIHHAMAINLVELDIEVSFKDVFDLLPMSIERAVPVCRLLQFIFSKEEEPLTYKYDGATNAISKENSSEVKSFLKKEKALLEKWITETLSTYPDFDAEKNAFDLEIAEAVSDLCIDFFEINPTGEVITTED